jgi:hypothetical protein
VNGPVTLSAVPVAFLNVMLLKRLVPLTLKFPAMVEEPFTKSAEVVAPVNVAFVAKSSFVVNPVLEA